MANTAWAVANLRVRDGKLMDSISAQARARLRYFEGSDFSSTAWAFSTLELQHSPLLDAISAEAIRKLASLGPQQLGTLADLGLQCQPWVEERLRAAVEEFAAGVPKVLSDFRRGAYARLVDNFQVDNFGTRGDRHLLDELGIRECPAGFTERAAKLAVAYQENHPESWWRSEGLLHQRVVSYAELELQGPEGCLPGISGCRYQQNGYQGARQAEEWIVSTTLPFNHNVDRSLCSENQLLARVCEEVAAATRSLHEVHGWLWLFVTGAPCLSCVGAMRQFQLILPGVAFSVSIGEEMQLEGLMEAE